MKVQSFISFILLFFTFGFTGCNNKQPEKSDSYQPVFSTDTSEKNTLIFGFPNFSYGETSAPFIKYLNEHLSGAKLKTKASLTYDSYIQDLTDEKFDITFISGVVAPKLENNGYTIIGKIMDDKSYTGVIFTRKDRGIKKIADLKTKRIAIVPFRMIPGTMMPLYYLYQHGLDVNNGITRTDVPSFESAIVATYLGKTDAGVCLKRNWEVYIRQHPEILTKVELKWETPPLINNALLIKKTIDSNITNQLIKALFSMPSSQEGKMALDVLGIKGFEKADKKTYDPMLEFKKKYDAVIL